MSDDLERMLDPEELDALQSILLEREDGEEGLLVDAIQGMLTAIAIGPTPVAPEAWMPLIVDDGRAFASEDDARTAVRLILRLHEGVQRSIQSEDYHPILSEIERDEDDDTDGARLSARGWCEGFSLGVDLCAEAWETRMANDGRLMELLGPVIALAADEDLFEPPEGGPLPALSEGDYEAALMALPDAVVAVARYWREHPAGAGLGTDAPARSVPRRRGGRWVH
jgi:uncharacterized protein